MRFHFTMLRTVFGRASVGNTTPVCRHSLRSQPYFSANMVFVRALCHCIRMPNRFVAVAAVPSRSALRLATRNGSSVARRSAWHDASRSTSCWPPKGKSAISKAAKLTPKKSCSSKKSNNKKKVKVAQKGATSRAVVAESTSRRRRRPLPRKLSPYQLQTEKYNKRVVAIARLWKEQRQDVQKPKKSLASRLA